MTQNNVLESVKTVLDITDDSKDKLLNIYINNATDFIYDYTNLKEIPVTLNSTIIDMAIFQYRSRELENVSSENIGNVSYTFTTDYPSTITDRLNSHKRVTVV